MGPIECYPGLVFPRSPSVEHARHGGRGLFIVVQRQEMECIVASVYSLTLSTTCKATTFPR